MATTITETPACSCLEPDDGEELRIFDEQFRLKVTGPETGDTYALLTGSVAPGGGPPLHAHPVPETVYVLSGEFEFTQRTADGVSTFRAGPGSVVHAPAGAPHRFENVRSKRSEVLIVVPVALVGFLRELAETFPPDSEPDMEKMLAINEKYQVETFHGGAGSRLEPPKDGATSARARELAWQLERENAAMIDTIERCTPEQWRAICADTDWTVGVEAHHVAVNEAAFASMVQGVVEGHPHPPMPTATLDAINARHADEFANVSVAETVGLLRDTVVQAAQLYRRLSDEQLALTTEMGEGYVVSVQDIIERHAIGEIERHGEAIRQAAQL